MPAHKTRKQIREERKQAKKSANTKNWKVEIVGIDTGDVVHTIKCGGGIDAERVEGGVLINIDEKRFFTRITEPDNS